MKKNILLAVLLFTGLALNAQIEKGKIMIGSSSNLLGNLNQLFGNGLGNNAGMQFGTYKTEYSGQFGNSESKSTITAFNINPTVGVFLSDNVMLGASVGAYILRIKDQDDDEKDGFDIITLSPIIRAYFKNEGKALPFAEIRGGIMSFKSYKDDADSAAFIGGKVGSSIFLNNNVSLDLFADYIYSSNKTEFDSGSEIKEKQGLLGFGIGLSIFLDGKSKD